MECPICGQPNEPDAKFCVRCKFLLNPNSARDARPEGPHMSSESRECPVCGQPNEPNAKFCIRCRARQGPVVSDASESGEKPHTPSGSSRPRTATRPPADRQASDTGTEPEAKSVSGNATLAWVVAGALFVLLIVVLLAVVPNKQPEAPLQTTTPYPEPQPSVSASLPSPAVALPPPSTASLPAFLQGKWRARVAVKELGGDVIHTLVFKGNTCTWFTEFPSGRAGVRNYTMQAAGSEVIERSGVRADQFNINMISTITNLTEINFKALDGVERLFASFSVSGPLSELPIPPPDINFVLGPRLYDRVQGQDAEFEARLRALTDDRNRPQRK